MKNIETEIKVVATETLAEEIKTELSLAEEKEINPEEAAKRIEANTMVQPDELPPRSD